MDPYAAQWAHHGYATSAPADASAATAAQAAYPAYYNYQQGAAAQSGAQVTTAGATAAIPLPPQPRYYQICPIFLYFCSIFLYYFSLEVVHRLFFHNLPDIEL